MNLNTKIAEALGWTLEPHGYWSREVVPGLRKGGIELPNWQADMNACERDLIPALTEKNIIKIEFNVQSSKMVCWLREVSWCYKGEGKTIPESFCKAFLEAKKQ